MSSIRKIRSVTLNSKRASWALAVGCSATIAGFVLAPRTASAEVTIVKKDNWEAYVAGRVNANNSTPIAVPSAAQGKLEQIAPGSVAAYQPVIYPDNLIAVVGYDPWLTSDGTLRP